MELAAKEGQNRSRYKKRLIPPYKGNTFTWKACKMLRPSTKKCDEIGLLEFCKANCLVCNFFSAEQLTRAKGHFTGSAFVQNTVGVDNVCERAAVLGSGGALLVGKQVFSGVTVAVAGRAAGDSILVERGDAMRLYIVGIGPGEATQMTQRAQAALERSELIVGYTAYVDLVRLFS